ncbi:MAG: acyl-CoA thioesterase [Holophaga sp.]
MTFYSQTIRLRIDWSDLDPFGHVNNLAILRYTQTARVHFMEEMDMMKAKVEAGISAVLASTTCQFRKQLFYPGNVTVQSWIDQVNNTSFHIRHKVLNEAQEIVAEVQDVLVMFDFNRNAKLRIPQEFRDRMQVP